MTNSKPYLDSLTRDSVTDVDRTSSNFGDVAVAKGLTAIAVAIFEVGMAAVRAYEDANSRR